MDVTGAAKKTLKLVERMQDKISGRQITHFLIIGFNDKHNLTAIRDLMEISAGGVAKAYDLGREKTSAREVYLFASVATGGGLPTIKFKRASKVSVVKEKDSFDKWIKFSGYEAGVTAKNLHGLRRHYTNL